MIDPRRRLLLWRRFDNEQSSKRSRFYESVLTRWVSLSISAKRTNRDVVEQIAQEAQIPIESLPGDLDQPIFPRGQVIFGYAFDEIARIYANMQWGLSDAGLKMALVNPTDSRIRRPVKAPPRRQPDVTLSKKRVEFEDSIATELATVKLGLNRAWTLEDLKQRHRTFQVWNWLNEVELNEIIKSRRFLPKARAKRITMQAFGLTSPETLKKDRQKVRHAEISRK